ncbi:carboxylating nicotinate-nucleotide diphosphorylase [Clostridia bacterium]|nr:carboxylating nicotinate-nucleotide diphosphorylase [Clostridia bacterium]
MNNFKWDRILSLWLEEDMPMGDVTTDSIFSDNDYSKGYFIAKESGVVAGLEYAKRVFELLDEQTVCKWSASDGDYLEKGEIIGTVEGLTSAILKGERLALNIMQRMSGIASMSRKYANALMGTSTKVVDTRKTIPGFRELDKEAVRLGGCYNHRYNLSDAAMIKDNHIAAAGGIKEAINKVRAYIPHTMKIEVEVSNMEEYQIAKDNGADIIMLDNMSTEAMQEIVNQNEDGPILEASGNVTLERVAEIASIGIDIISVGALTHSVVAMDISLKFK